MSIDFEIWEPGNGTRYELALANNTLSLAGWEGERMRAGGNGEWLLLSRCGAAIEGIQLPRDSVHFASYVCEKVPSWSYRDIAGVFLWLESHGFETNLSDFIEDAGPWAKDSPLDVAMGEAKWARDPEEGEEEHG